MSNLLERFIEKYPDGCPPYSKQTNKNDWKWNRDALENNPSITRGFIINHPELKIRYKPSKILNKQRDLTEIKCPSCSHLISVDFILQYPDGNPPSWWKISPNSWSWNISCLSQNPLITTDIVCAFPNNHPPPGSKTGRYYWKWNVFDLSQFLNMSPSFIEQHSDWDWSIWKLSQNPSITPEFIEKHDYNWKWNAHYLSYNTSITPRFIEKHADWKWDIRGLSQNTFEVADKRYEQQLLPVKQICFLISFIRANFNHTFKDSILHIIPKNFPDVLTIND